MTVTVDSVFRDYATDGVPSSGAHKPIKSEIRELLNARTNSANDLFATYDLLVADNNTVIGYAGSGASSEVASGDIISASGFEYEVQDASEANPHVTTVGGVKLKLVPGSHGYNAEAFGAIGDGSVSQDDMLTRLTAAWDAAIADTQDLYFPAGTYAIGNFNMPFKQQDASGGLLNCGGITMRGDGKTTIFSTESDDGADVFQLNGLDNITIRDIKITATLTAFSGSGSNGMSITNGWDRLNILDVHFENLPSVDSGSFIDGGKAVSFQPGTSGNKNGSAYVRCTVDGASYAFGMDFNVSVIATKLSSIHAHVIAENCYAHTVISGAEATGVIGAETHYGVTVRGSAMNCQRGVVLGRAHGVDVQVDVTNTKTAAQRILDPNGVTWSAASTNVEALYCAMAHNSRIYVTGDVADCDYKAQIGGATAGASGLFGATNLCDIYLDLRGTSATSDINEINSGGNSLRKSWLRVTDITGSIPSAFYTTTKLNQIIQIGTFGNNQIAGSVVFPSTQVPSSDPNTLDDYEEGTFTPILTDTSLSDEGATYSFQTGTYTKIGNRVIYELYLTLTDLGSLTSGAAASIIGLPYTSSSTAIFYPVTCTYAANLNMTAAALPSGRVLQNTSRIVLQKWSATETAGHSAMTVGEISADGTIMLAGEYRA
jgi:hypothetical protein